MKNQLLRPISAPTLTKLNLQVQKARKSAPDARKRAVAQNKAMKGKG